MDDRDLWPAAATRLGHRRDSAPSRRAQLAFRPAAALPGRRPWAVPSGPAAMLSGGLTGRRRSFSGAKGIFPCADLKKYVVAIQPLDRSFDLFERQ